MAYKFTGRLICSVTGFQRYGRKEAGRLKNKRMSVFFVILAALILFVFLKWLYSPDVYEKRKMGDIGLSGGNSTGNLQVFGYDIEKRLKLRDYSNNIAIQLLNSVITIAKVSYETAYECPMQGLPATITSRMTDGLNTDIRNPLTYLNFAFTAFSQYDPSAFGHKRIVDNKSKDAAASNITDFESVPEGAIFFSEEDEYKAEGLVSKQQSMAPAAIQANQIAEETIEIPGKISMDNKSPQILIYHSHSTESFMPNTAGNYHTSDEKYNVVSVGKTLTKELQEKYKYKVLHSRTQHDKVSYAYSYANSLVTIKNSINKYKSIKVILDLHRDAFDTGKYTYAEKMAKKSEYTASINGKNAAKIMLVIARGNPNYDELEKFAVYIKKKMDKLYPGLFFKIDVKSRGKYNQYLSNHSMLIEVGCMLNTVEEAQYSAVLLSRVLGEVINDLKE